MHGLSLSLSSNDLVLSWSFALLDLQFVHPSSSSPLLIFISPHLHRFSSSSSSIFSSSLHACTSARAERSDISPASGTPPHSSPLSTVASASTADASIGGHIDPSINRQQAVEDVKSSFASIQPTTEDFISTPHPTETGGACWQYIGYGS
eukprot:m.263560 g.263560  ORF g.263560 m.263560 type:complete len:150 (+) comp53725_c0_seq1:180-629(+)